MRLHRNVSDGRYVQDFGAGVAAHGLQFLEHFSWNPYRLLLAHPPKDLLHQGLCTPPGFCSTAGQSENPPSTHSDD